MDNVDLLGNVFVNTVDTIRCKIFMEFSHMARLNLIVFGPRGCGKSKLLQEFVYGLGRSSGFSIRKEGRFLDQAIMNKQQACFFVFFFCFCYCFCFALHCFFEISPT